MDIQGVNERLSHTINEIQTLQAKFNDISLDNLHSLLEKINQNNSDLKELSETHHIHAEKLDVKKSTSLLQTVGFILNNKNAINQEIINMQGANLAPILFNALQELHNLLNRNLKDIKTGDKVEGKGESSAL